ncbi:OmpP1/FadL family transporter [Hymenobacter negativus]|uniref:Aromatic hydrocarbon degradation protein n=1 Tax=Hymenobacter negativus TaxID=2795026 RepID=A0ABS0QAA7_9BACT|nr:MULTISPECIES: hypothetical protein [Bacteria]MBH8559560.1 hypothetical protein [Hymenobacter negativus]MBH8570846.1 hypothetical protein [Hymenobacter negativus]MBR7210583.1 hypothetical protein [Microvirga sp. STS02]
MKKRIIWLSLALVAGQAGHAFAQDASDALRYSRLQFGGPARTQGIGGANVALGADFGNLTSNPAGLGMYQKSEVHFTPGIGIGQSDARIDGGTTASQSAEKNSLHVASLGGVFTTRRPDNDQTSDWRGGAFALGFSRVADFNSASSYQGTINNNQSYLSRLQPAADAARGATAFADLDKQASSGTYTSNLGLAYGAYLANIRSSRAGADSAVVLRKQGNALTQGETLTTSGSISQFDIGYGANYRDRLYIGGAIGIVSSNYTQLRTLTEADNDPNTHFNSLTSNSQLKTSGKGFNARVGLIYRALDNLRVGASVQTPTFMQLTDTYSETLTANYSAQGTDRVPSDLPVGDYSVSLPVNDYAYTITTPFRANGGVAYTLGKHGFLTGDIEYVGYGQARLHNDSQNANGDNYSFATENSDIQARYKNTVNLRFGAEGRFDVFRLRLGYARYGDPYKADTNNERLQSFYTAGAGLRQGNFFLDAAVVYTTVDQLYTPYSLNNGLQPVIKVNGNRYTTNITAGITF